MTAVAFAALFAAMIATIITASSAIGMYEPLLAVELAAIGVLAVLWLAHRRSGAPDEMIVDRLRRHRERRGF